MDKNQQPTSKTILDSVVQTTAKISHPIVIWAKTTSKKGKGKSAAYRAKHCPDALRLPILARYPYPAVRLATLQNPLCPIQTVHQLALDPNPQVREAAQRLLSHITTTLQAQFDDHSLQQARETV